MNKRKDCLAMLLAGGQGSRLGALTKDIAKPAVSFGGKYRIIDFSLSNCSNSNIDTVGVLTQYRPLRLNAYIATGRSWDLTESDGGVFILPPYATESGGQWYKGTADAIYQNLDFIKLYNPKYVLILSGDHLYTMDYQDLLQEHIKNGAEVTISTMRVDWKEASRFGILTADETGKINKFTEKPKNPDSNLASMGIYIFNTDLLIQSLIEDSQDDTSDHDFGKNIIPTLLSAKHKLYIYEFEGFWRDIGTISSYYETSMDLLEKNPKFNLSSKSSPIMSNSNIYPPTFIGANAEVDESIISNGTKILGTVKHSIISNSAIVEENATIIDSILLPGAKVCSGATVQRAILGENSIVESNVTVGNCDPSTDITVLGNKCTASSVQHS